MENPKRANGERWPCLSGAAMSHGLILKISAQPGRRDEIVAVIQSSFDWLRTLGCVQFNIGISADDDVTIWVSEVWLSNEHHESASKLPEYRASLKKAAAMRDGDPNVWVTTVVDYRGVSD
jgi:quinol monooxygenase YgiN